MSHEQQAAQALPSMHMIKLHLEIDLIALKYKKKHAEPHYIIFAIEGQDRQSIHHEQRLVQKNQVNINFDKTIPLPFYIIIGSDKNTLCPFNFTFTSKFKQPIRRIISILQGVILNHYFRHDLFEDIKPLEQLYLFQEGSLKYLIHMKPQIIQDKDEVRQYRRLFRKQQGSLSGKQISILSPIKTKQASKAIKMKEQIKMDDQQYELPLDEPVLRLKNTSLHQMSVEEIVQKLQQSRSKEQKREPSYTSAPKTTFISHKLGRKGSYKPEDQLLKNAKLKMNITLFLIFSGLLALIIGSLFTPGEDSVRKKIRKPSKAKK